MFLPIHLIIPSDGKKAMISILTVQQSVDPFPQTSFLAQTNSLGVVTGMPAVATSIPAMPPAQNSQPGVVTSQPAVATIPAVGTTGIVTLLLPGPSTNVNSTQTLIVSANNSTTIILNSPNTASASASGSGAKGSNGASGAGASPTSSGSGGKASNAAGVNAAAGGFIGAAAFVAAFL